MSNERPRLLTVREVADWFGVNPMTIYRKVGRGELPAIKFGKNWLFSEDALTAWIESHTEGGESPKRDFKAGKIPNQVEALLQKAAKQFDSMSEIQLVYLFGSAAEGLATPLSDIDVAYLDDGTKAPFDMEAKLEEIIMKAFPSASRIDLVPLKGAPVSMQYKVVRDGRLIYKRSDDLLADFVEFVVTRYLDYATFLNRFYCEVDENLKEVA